MIWTDLAPRTAVMQVERKTENGSPPPTRQPQARSRSRPPDPSSSKSLRIWTYRQHGEDFHAAPIHVLVSPRRTRPSRTRTSLESPREQDPAHTDGYTRSASSVLITDHRRTPFVSRLSGRCWEVGYGNLADFADPTTPQCESTILVYHSFYLGDPELEYLITEVEKLREQAVSASHIAGEL
ncbi:unnamed protein product [Phytophthora lilii]|uniref:Unnamed protein product n=1 Tax=Phytophthora lilii TaxID=2077276 RepID=A0A9W6U0M5_9STRA|nr:unnamed protein product [Phytophthora lilii]